MIFPIGDDQVKGGYYPFVSYAFIVINVIVFIIQFQDPSTLLICDYAPTPNDVLSGKETYELLFSMFMHGSWGHLLGNMVFLWIFADNIEATIGSVKFIAFYLLGGLAASALHMFLGNGLAYDLSNCCNMCACAIDATIVCPGSIPTVGASGAIAAVMGAYMIMFPKSRVKLFVLFLFRSIYISSVWFLGFWIAQELWSGFGSLGVEAASQGGTAFWAHIGGFAFGAGMGLLFRFGAKSTKYNMKPATNKPNYNSKDFV